MAHLDPATVLELGDVLNIVDAYSSTFEGSVAPYTGKEVADILGRIRERIVQRAENGPARLLSIEALRSELE